MIYSCDLSIDVCAHPWPCLQACTFCSIFCNGIRACMMPLRRHAIHARQSLSRLKIRIQSVHSCNATAFHAFLRCSWAVSHVVNELIKLAGADADRVDRLASRLSFHSQRTMQSIVQARRVLEATSDQHTQFTFQPP